MKGRSQDVDAGVEQDDRADEAGNPEHHRPREEGHPCRGEREPGEDEGETTPAARDGAVRDRSGPRHEQEQEHVVDGHDRPDGGAVVAERVAHEQRDEGAEEGSSDAEEESAKADDQQGAVRRSGWLRRCGDHEAGMLGVSHGAGQ